jgi:hypothetical protein
VDGVVFQEVGEIADIREIVDANDFATRPLHETLERAPSDATETIDPHARCGHHDPP